MKINFLGMKAKNFLSIGNNFETFNLCKNPFTVIIGKNGAGKSTLLSMITYALYKKPYTKINLSQLINSTNKKNMLVELAFKIGESTYLIRRGEKPKVFEIYKDEVLIEPDPSIGDMQTYLEDNILKQNFKTFCQINVIGKSTYKQFMDLSAAERRSVVEDILDSNIYSVMQSLAKDDLKKLNEAIVDLNRDITIANNNIQNAKALIAKVNEDNSSQINDLWERKRAKEVEYSAEEIKFEDHQHSYDEKKKSLDEDFPPHIIPKLSEKIGDLNSKIALNKSVIIKCTNFIDKIDQLEECPHCLQIVSKEHKEDILRQYMIDREEAKLENESLQIEVNSFTKKHQEYTVKKDWLSQKMNDILISKSALRSIQGSIKDYEDMIRKLELKAKEDKQSLPNLSELQQVRVDLDTRVDNLTKDTVDLKTAIKLLGDDGIKANLINKYIPIINQAVNHYLSTMNMFVEFNLDSEFNESVKAINRETFTYNSFSEGQKFRIDIAILLAWRVIAQKRNSMTTNIFFLDEIADGSLDDEGMEDFISILKDLADVQNVFIISHKESTVNLGIFNGILEVSMGSDGFSRYNTI